MPRFLEPRTHTASTVPPLLVIELLHRINSTFVEYFGSSTEKTLLAHTVVVYQVLEEMLDNGFPLATESNILMVHIIHFTVMKLYSVSSQEMIRPPSIIDPVTGKKRLDSKRYCFQQYHYHDCSVRETLPGGQVTITPWRRTGVTYVTNGPITRL